MATTPPSFELPTLSRGSPTEFYCGDASLDVDSGVKRGTPKPGKLSLWASLACHPWSSNAGGSHERTEPASSSEDALRSLHQLHQQGRRPRRPHRPTPGAGGGI